MSVAKNLVVSMWFVYRGLTRRSRDRKPRGRQSAMRRHAEWCPWHRLRRGFSAQISAPPLAFGSRHSDLTPVAELQNIHQGAIHIK